MVFPPGDVVWRGIEAVPRTPTVPPGALNRGPGPRGGPRVRGTRAVGRGRGIAWGRGARVPPMSVGPGGVVAPTPMPTTLEVLRVRGGEVSSPPVTLAGEGRGRRGGRGQEGGPLRVAVVLGLPLPLPPLLLLQLVLPWELAGAPGLRVTGQLLICLLLYSPLRRGLLAGGRGGAALPSLAAGVRALGPWGAGALLLVWLPPAPRLEARKGHGQPSRSYS